MPEQYPGDWARKSYYVLEHMIQAVHEPTHPQIHIVPGDSQDTELQRHSADAMAVVGGDSLEMSVEWGEHGPIIWVCPEYSGEYTHYFWSSDPLDADDPSTYPWEDVDMSLRLIKEWFDRHRGPHRYTKTLREELGFDPVVPKDV